MSIGLRDFIIKNNHEKGRFRNTWTVFRYGEYSIEVYLRIGGRYIDEVWYEKVLDMAAIRNLFWKNELSMHRRTGIFRELMYELMMLAIEGEYDGIFVENLFNKRLLEPLKRYGYEVVHDRYPFCLFLNLPAPAALHKPKV